VDLTGTNPDQPVPITRTLYQNLLWRGIFYLSSFALNIAIARQYEAAGSGYFYYLISIYSLGVLFISISLESGITYYASRQEIAPAKLQGFAIAWSLAAGLISLLAAYIFVPAQYNGATRSFLLLSAFCFISGNMLSTYAAGLFYAKEEFRLSNSISAVFNFVLIAMLVSGVLKEEFFKIYFISFLVLGVVVSIGYSVKYNISPLTGFLNLAEFKLLFRYCLPAFLANLLFFLLYRLDYWFVENWCSPEDLGNYIQVSKLGQLFFILPTILAGAVFPLTAGGKKEEVNQMLATISRLMLMLYILACGVLAACGQWFFPALFGKSFGGMYIPFLLLIPGILSLSGLFTLTAYYAGKNRLSVNIYGTLIALAVIIAGDSIFIPRYGIHAAALVSSIGYIVYQVYVLLIFKKEYGTPLPDFFIPKPTDLAVLKRIFSRIIGQ